MEIIKEIIADHIKYRKQILKLAKTDLKKSYKGSVLGPVWLVAQPMIRVFVYFFAFVLGLRQGSPIEGYPKLLWLMAGLIPWFYAQGMIPGGPKSIRRYTYLVTKIKFPVSTIPTFVSMSLFSIHIMMTGVLIAFFIGYGFMPDIYYLQLPLYMLMNFAFFTLWGLFSGVLGAISRDFVNFIKSITIAFFWLSGIIYPLENINIPWIRAILLVNPVTILVNGYRNVFIYKTWFFETPVEMRNFCIILVVMFLLAVWAYKKLRKDIPDVL